MAAKVFFFLVLFYFSNCFGVGYAAFIDQGNETVLDDETGLIWQQESHSYTWGNALAFCENLSLGGGEDWRLPNIKELISLIDDTTSHPAINPAFFVSQQRYWSSTTKHKDWVGSTPPTDKAAWTVDFRETGTVSIEDKSLSDGCRCVRGGSVTNIPFVYSISPSLFSADETNIDIDIIGRNFRYSNGPPKVKIISAKATLAGQDSNGWAQSTFVNENLITVRIEKFHVGHTETIGLIVANMDGATGANVSAGKFKQPKITTMLPSESSVHSTNISVTILGENFYRLGTGYPEIYFEGVGLAPGREPEFLEGNLISQSEIQFTIPSFNNIHQKERSVIIVYGEKDLSPYTSETTTFHIPDSTFSIIPAILLLQ